MSSYFLLFFSHYVSIVCIGVLMANWSRSDKFFWEQKKRAAKYAAEEKKKDETVPGK